MHTFRHGSVAAWLFTIARNTVIDATRRRRLQQPLEFSEWLPDLAKSPVEQAIDLEQQSVLHTALQALTPEQRPVVELRLAGLSSKEIAEVRDISVNAVKSSQFRAYANLRRILAEKDTPGVTR